MVARFAVAAARNPVASCLMLGTAAWYGTSDELWRSSPSSATAPAATLRLIARTAEVTALPSESTTASDWNVVAGRFEVAACVMSDLALATASVATWSKPQLSTAPWNAAITRRCAAIESGWTAAIVRTVESVAVSWPSRSDSFAVAPSKLPAR